MKLPSVALYATVHPAVKGFVPAWYESVRKQSDEAFDLWLGVDAMTKAEVVETLGGDPRAHWVIAEAGENGSSVRLRAMQRMVAHYDGVIFVDSDDVMLPSRIAEARRALQEHDVVGCPLRVIDREGVELGPRFGPERDWRAQQLLVRYNVFGLSNSAYRSSVLRRCLPFPNDCILIDWYLATRAWLGNADLWFDTTAHMLYRQYDANIARIIPPFRPEDIRAATQRVLAHYSFVLPRADAEAPQHAAALRAAQRDIAAFRTTIDSSPDALQVYTQSLNELPPRYVWWWAVANPQLSHLWN